MTSLTRAAQLPVSRASDTPNVQCHDRITFALNGALVTPTDGSKSYSSNIPTLPNKRTSSPASIPVKKAKKIIELPRKKLCQNAESEHNVSARQR